MYNKNNAVAGLLILAVVIVMLIFVGGLAYINSISPKDTKSNTTTPVNETPQNDVAETPVVPTETSDPDELKGNSDVGSFKSERYKIILQYSKEKFGEVSTEYNEENFKTETIKFSKSKITLTYPRFEGGFGGTLEQSSAKSLNNVEFKVSVLPQGVNQDKFMIIATQAEQTTSGSVTIMSPQMIETQEEADKYKAEIIELIGGLSIDFTNNQ